MTICTNENGQLSFPDDRRYSKEHVWVRNAGSEISLGISDYAQDQLGEIIFIDLPAVGGTFNQDAEFGVVESAKTASELYMPTRAKILSVNASLEDKPTLVNQSPYEDGWMITVEADENADRNGLMSRDEYVAFLNDLKSQ